MLYRLHGQLYQSIRNTILCSQIMYIKPTSPLSFSFYFFHILSTISSIPRIPLYRIKIIVSRDGNFSPPCLTRPSPLRPALVFPAPQRQWGGNGARFQPRTTGQDGDGFRPFRPTPPRPSPSPPRPAPPRITKGYNCKFFIP